MEKISRIWFGFNDKIRFLIVGGFNSFVSFVLFVLLMHVFTGCGHDYIMNVHNFLVNYIPLFKYIVFIQFIRQLSLILAWFLSSFVSFTTQRYLVFNVRGPIIKQYLKCLSSWCAGYLVNAVVLEIFAAIFEKFSSLPPVIENDIAQFFALGLSAVVNFLLLKYFAFKTHKNN